MLGNLSASDSHCESDIGLLKGRGIVGTVSSDSDDFAELTKSSHKKVFVLRARAGKDSEIGLNCLEGLHVANSLFAVFPLDEAAHALVELGALHDRVGLGEQFVVQNVALTSDGLGSDKVVASDHADCNTGLVAKGYGVGDLFSDNILDTSDGNQSVATLLDVVKDLSLSDVFVLFTSLIWLKVFVAERDGSQGLAGIESDGIEELLLDAIVQGDLLALVVQIAVAAVKDDFGSTLHVATSVVAVLCFTAVLNDS